MPDWGTNHGVGLGTRAEHVAWHLKVADQQSASPSVMGASDEAWLSHVMWAFEATEDLIDWLVLRTGGTFHGFVFYWKRVRAMVPLRIRLTAEQSFFDRGEPWTALITGFKPLADVSPPSTENLASGWEGRLEPPPPEDEGPIEGLWR